MFEIDLNNRKLSKYENLVRVEFIKTFSSENIDKVFFIKEFFQNYTSCLSNQQKTKMKEHFIQSIKLFQQFSTGLRGSRMKIN